MPWYIHSLRRIYQPCCMAQVDGSKYAYAVAEPYTAGRLKAAWWVLTGKAFAFEWPKPGDLEAAIELPFLDRKDTLIMTWPDMYVHKIEDKWQFEDETGAIDEQRFDTREEAVEALEKYAQNIG